MTKPCPELVAVATAAACLDDKIAARSSVVAGLSRALTLDPNPERRRQITREFLDLTDPTYTEPDL